MKIAVVGGGAIGLLIATYLSEVSQVSIVTRTKEQATIINSDGIIRRKGDFGAKFLVNAVPFSEIGERQINSFDIIFVAVKQYDLNSILPLFKYFFNCAVFLQNGLGHVEKIRGFKNPFIGIVEHGAMRMAENKVNHTGIGQVILGSVNGSILPKIEPVNDFPLFFSNNIYQIQKEKLVINAVINPITTLYGVKNGQLITNLKLNELAHDLFLEICSILHIDKGEDVTRLWTRVLEICAVTKDNYSSMHCDFKAGRKSEIDNILGYILKRQNKTDNATLIKRIYDLLKEKN